MKWTRADWLNLLLFGGLIALFFWRILTPNLADRQSFPPGDFYAQFWAFTTLDVRSLSQGILPLWNPYTFAGAPFWADVQAAVFYPFSLLTLILSAPWGFSAFALEIEAIFHFWLAAAFMYLFSRELTGSRPAAVVAALTFTFGGYLTGYPSQQLAVLETDVWLPLILFCLYRAAQTTRRPRLLWLTLAGAAFGVALLAGHPQSGFIVAAIATAYLLFLWLTPAEPAPTNPNKMKDYGGRLLCALPPLALFLLTGLALAAIQYIPAIEYTLLSVRAAGTYDKMSGGFPLIDLIQLLLPGQVSHYSPLYVGVVGLLLAAVAVLHRPHRHSIFWGALTAIALLISLGGNTFLYSPLYLTAPGFSIFRGQERWALAAAFGLAVLAGYGFAQLSEAGFAGWVRRGAKYLFFFALLLTLLAFYGLNDTGWSPDSPFYGLLEAATLLTILGGLTWLLFSLSDKIPPRLLTGLVVTLICLDLFSVNWQTNLYPQLPEWHTQLPAAVQAIQTDAAATPDKPFRVYNEFRLYDNYGVPFALEDLWGASPLRPSRYDAFMAPPMPIERTWALLNVKYVITWRQELYVPSTIIYQEPAADGTTYVHRLNQAGSRTWLVGRIESADDATALQKIADPNFDPSRTALLDPATAASIPAPSPIPNSPSTIHHSPFISPNRLSYQISAPAPALLVLSEPDYPGWQASVDGQPAPLLRADYLLRAVPVPAGEHTIELVFRPPSFFLGAAFSVAALLFIIGMAGWAYLGRRHGHPKSK